MRPTKVHTRVVASLSDHAFGLSPSYKLSNPTLATADNLRRRKLSVERQLLLTDHTLVADGERLALAHFIDALRLGRAGLDRLGALPLRLTGDQ